MNRRRFWMCAIVAAAFVMGGCSAASSNGGGGDPPGVGGDGGPGNADGGVTDPGAAANAGEQVRQALVAIVAKDPRLAATTPLAPGDYQALADAFGAVPGVTAADYVGDSLGSIQVKVNGGGVLLYRHITNDTLEAAMLPAEADFSSELSPKWQDGWKGPVAAPLLHGLDTSTYATRFPVAQAAPDPTFAADNAVSCPNNGKIAIVDFLWTEAHRDFPGLYSRQYDVDGVMLYDRIARIGKAGGFTVDVLKDEDITLANYTKLQDYAIVLTVGHGGRPGTQTANRLGSALVSILTAETFDPAKTTAFGMTYAEAWTKGYLFYGVTDKKISYTPWLFRDHYKPSVPQLMMLNECWSMLPFNLGLDLDHATGKWTWNEGVTGPLYNFGDALMDAGVKAVFGYVSPATPEAIVQNTMPFLRRTFGGYSAKDTPPAPLRFWPTCMGVQTYFRLPNTPQLPIYGNKYRAGSMYTMYAGSENLLLRKECPGSVPDAELQAFMLGVGTPAPAFQSCWDAWWSQGKYPSGLQDPVCAMGDDPTTLELATDAACGVKVARQATSALLDP